MGRLLQIDHLDGDESINQPRVLPSELRPRGAGPESILTMVVMDFGLSPSASPE